MESNSTLFKEAIAEAKAVREAAIANAKAALEETITPRLSKLIANKLNELEEEDRDIEEEKQKKKKSKESSKESDKDEMPEDEMPEDEMPEDEMPEDEMPKDEMPKEEDDIEVGDMDIEVGDMDISELESFITKAVRDELQAMGIQGQSDTEPGIEDDMKGTMEDSDDINLEELLAELELEEVEDEPVYEYQDEPDIEDILQELKSFRTRNEKSNKQNRQLTEALRTINTLKRDLTEVNLLNAKLLYLSKLIKNHSLSESQTVNIMASFDKATTTAEAKLVYESTVSSLAAKAKVKVNESRGFASRPTGNAPKRVITEGVDVLSTDVVNRFQILAGIKKPI